MNYFIYFLYAMALVLLGVNATRLDFDHLFEGDSVIALISIVSIICGVLLLRILQLSRKANNKKNR